MARFTIVGASGKVGQEVLNLITAAPDDSVAVAAVSANSLNLGETNVDAPRFVEAIAENLVSGDIIIDFSTPAGTINMLDQLVGNPMPIVVGTTGFSPEQHERLAAEGRHRPILIGANFTLGFEAFASAAMNMAQAIPQASITVGEVYNANKKPTASGTTQRLVAEIGEAAGRGTTIGEDIQRIGDTAGINTVCLDLGFARIDLKLTVHSRQAYAAGAIEAAKWLLGKPNGVYAPKDLLT